MAIVIEQLSKRNIELMEMHYDAIWKHVKTPMVFPIDVCMIVVDDDYDDIVGDAVNLSNAQRGALITSRHPLASAERKHPMRNTHVMSIR